MAPVYIRLGRASCECEAMPIARLIYVTVPAVEAGEAERVWKEDCAPVMIKQPGCLSEELLKCTDTPGEYISYSEWQDEAAIERYDDSDAHREIERHTQRLKVSQPPIVKHYQVVG